MFKNFRDKIALSGVTVLMIGVALLIFTFVSAYGFLTQSLNIFTSEDLVQTFGAALAPLIATSIRIMYLGVMGWIGSLVTIRGVTIIANAPKMETTMPLQQKPVIASQPQPKPVAQKPIQQSGKETKPQETKPPEAKPPEAKPSEPQIIVIPPEEVTQQPQQQQSNGNGTQPSNGQPQQSA